MPRSNQETLGNGCVCETGCDSCDRLAEAFAVMKEVLRDTIARHEMPDHLERRPAIRDLIRSSRAALRLAERVKGD